MAEKTKKTTTKKVTKKVEEPVVAEALVPETAEKPTVTAKAGKRSAKALKETEAKIIKEEKKAETKEAEADKAPEKPKQNPPRSRLERRSKKYREVVKLYDQTKSHALAEALELAVKTSPVRFDATVELHLNLNVDPRHADQNVRDTVMLPAGTGKTLRVAVLGDPAVVTAAKAAGADLAGLDDLLAQFDKEQLNFDVLIATPAVMSRLGKYARLLGPKGLMPNPKSGTVTNDVAKAVQQAKAGRVEYRVDSTGIIHVAIGKVSFGKDKLTENAQAIFSNIRANKPASVKTALIKTAHVTTSMGPSILIEIESI